MAYNKMFYWSDDDSSYVTNVPALPGCMADGESDDKDISDSLIESYYPI